ncbi:MAG TPA: hypothetical protein VGD23_01315 [Sphingomicrobium sp.]
MTRSAAREIIALLVAVLLPFAAVMLVMIQFQANLLFPVHAVPPAGPLPAGAERLQVKTADGFALHGVHIEPASEATSPRLLLLGFGGNAWNAQEVATYLHTASRKRMSSRSTIAATVPRREVLRRKR